MSYSERQVKIEDLRKLLEKFQSSKAQYEIYTNRAKAPFTVLIKLGIDFREHKELQRWDSNWKAYRDMINPAWHPEKPLTGSNFMFADIPLGTSVIGLAKEDLEHLLALQERKHLWGLKTFEWDIKKLRNMIVELRSIYKLTYKKVKY